MERKLIQASGNFVTGDRFWDREKEAELFETKLQEGAHMLIVAQRRIGKTSLMKEMALRLKDKYSLLFIDLQGAKDAADAIFEMSMATRPHKNIWDKVEEIFLNVVSKITGVINSVKLLGQEVSLRDGLTQGNWSQKGDRLFKILKSADKPVVLLMDEVPIMISNMLKGGDFVVTPERRNNVNEFMSWLRKKSIEYQGTIRIVISGSIGLEPILNQAKLSATLNNFYRFELKPWDDNAAIGCLSALASQYGVIYKDSAERAIVERLGCCIPHHVQMFFAYIHERCERTENVDVEIQDIDTVYKEDMLGTRGYSELIHYEERLKMVLGPDMLSLAIEMLAETAISGTLNNELLAAFQKKHEHDTSRFEGMSIQDVLQQIIAVFLHDGYFRLSNDGYVFISKIMREWYKKKYPFYQPILKREG
ncbi:MAG: ATP-binding protein [Nitrospirae bacterium]|nr:ATP-binding protein [Nitrospirota bacterium]MBF0534230.1 ATP-binding protein [Nitrospirota bacterium]MBF0615856.1 ATP-binding protein [Nitrospirota bacterium]